MNIDLKNMENIIYFTYKAEVTIKNLGDRTYPLNFNYASDKFYKPHIS